jgi:signal transduction histidine kinase
MGEAVLEAADRTQVLLDSLMVLARSQQALPRREGVDLAVAARTAAETTAAEAAVRGVTVRTDLESAPLTGDPALIERLVANLVENAVRHNVIAGTVAVTTRPGLVRVENTGPAIRLADVRRLAEPFERLQRDAAGPGAGLGLSIVRAVADAHGARLHLEPRRGGGLVAEVLFDHMASVGAAAAPDSASRRAGSLTAPP